MGFLRLELPCPTKVDGITADPKPDWSLDDLLTELNSVEEKLKASSAITSIRDKADVKSQKNVKRSNVGFVMRAPNDEWDDSESEGEDIREQKIVATKQFPCDDLHSSDIEDSELALAMQPYLMDEVGSVEVALYELIHQHQLRIKEEIRNYIAAFETELTAENRELASAFARIEKYKEERREFDRKLDAQFQRRIAEALDSHLTAVQRDHELKSQMEERRLRSDADEEAKRKEKALQEERLNQEKAKAEAEAKRRADEVKKAALEEEKKALKEAAEKEAIEAARGNSVLVSEAKSDSQQINLNVQNPDLQSGSNGVKSSQPTGSTVRIAESASQLEQRRLLKLKELDEQNQSLMANPNMKFDTIGRHIGRLLRQISGTKDSVRAKSTELLKILKNPSCPQSFIALFAKKVVSHAGAGVNESHAFACAHVLVPVISQIPGAMEILLAEFHRACIYTVPKHIVYTKSEFASTKAYYKAIGFQEDDGKIEDVKNYLTRLESYMRFYGALLQTEPRECWAWLARFLNTLPADKFTCTALNVFLQSTGFSLYRQYKSQFKKVLDVIINVFLKAAKQREDKDMNPIIAEIQSYIEDGMFVKQPEGQTLLGTLHSRVFTVQQDTRPYYY